MRKILTILAVALATVAGAQNDFLPRRQLLDSLSEGNTYSVKLPEELEPNATMNFYLGCKGQKPEKGYPVFLYLHGSGPREMEWQTGLKLAQYFKDSPSMYIIPQIPQEGQWYRWWQKSKQWVWGQLFAQLLGMKEVDASRIYIFGISEGGYGSQRLASFYADYLAGAGPMAGGEPLKNAPVENLGHVAFSFLTGAEDKMFYRYKLTAETGARLDSMRRIYPDEYVHNVQLIPERGHHIDYSPTTPWLSQYTRTAQPRHWMWENYEMDGLKRNAFYNVEVLEEGSEVQEFKGSKVQEFKGSKVQEFKGSSERIMYEFTVRNNNINLNVRSVRYTTTWQDPNWHIDMLFDKMLCAVRHGRVRIYLSDQLIDTRKPVTIRINGKKMFKAKVDACEDCRKRAQELWHDPLRKFDRAVEVKW